MCRIFLNRKNINTLQVTFSEKGTKITTQTPIQKFEILEISLWNWFRDAIFPLAWLGTLFWTEKMILLILSEKWRIPNFRMWVWEVIFVPFSEKVTCTALALIEIIFILVFFCRLLPYCITQCIVKTTLEKSHGGFRASKDLINYIAIIQEQHIQSESKVCFCF